MGRALFFKCFNLILDLNKQTKKVSVRVVRGSMSKYIGSEYSQSLGKYKVVPKMLDTQAHSVHRKLNTYIR